MRSGAAAAGCGRGALAPLLVAVNGLGVMVSERALEALQAQRTHRGDGLEVGVETHQHRVVVQSHGGHQEVEAHDGPADLAAGLGRRGASGEGQGQVAAWVPPCRA